MAFPINHILFPTDFSKNAEHALQFAAEIASKTNARLTLFHASQVKMDLAPNFEKKKEHLVEEGDREFEKLVATLKKDHYDQLPISTLIKDGQAVSAILNQVEEQQVDLIVMGTKGVTTNRNTIFGSVTSRVIQKSPVPVLTIPADGELDNFNNFIFTTAFKEGDPAALEQTILLAKHFGSAVEIFHVSDQKNIDSQIRFRGFRELIKERVNYNRLGFHHRYDLDLFPAVGEFIDEYPKSLLVMIRYKKTFWEKLTKRNHSKELAFYSQVPLLVLPGDYNGKHSTIFEDSRTQKR